MVHIHILLYLFAILYNRMHNHKPIEVEGEIVCRECGIVLDREEIIEDYRDPHGKATLWQYGLGSINKGEREDISIISNICQRLNLTEVISIEVLTLYNRYVKDDKDRLTAIKLALLEIARKYRLKIDKKIIKEVSELNFGKSGRDYIYELEVSNKLAKRFGASRAVKHLLEVSLWI
ncbi:MAG: hypothetical protein KatS3mg003_1896 [Candidatus Nitrosocaldaceae archaeon]|nr:MAG: hypothetical protein KatS3mg003_1896 [Candidatus Nitrosocaldaceae archaeon]